LGRRFHERCWKGPPNETAIRTDEEKAAEAAKRANCPPDAYQAKLAGWLFRNMSANLIRTLGEPTATYLETVAGEASRVVQQRLKENRK
jgi:hypothetical protein